MKKLIILIIVLITSNQTFSQNNIDLGIPGNQWSVRAATNGPTELYIVPMGNSWWDWGKATIFKKNGDINVRNNLSVSGSISANELIGKSGGKLTLAGYNWAGTQRGILLRAPEEGIDFETFTAGVWKSRMFIADNGNVGIGTNNPSSRLTVDGTTTINAPDVNYSYGLKINTTKDLTKAFTVHNNGGPELFAIYGNGVVNTKKIYAEEIQVVSSSFGISWPDYVFKKEYKLPSLSQVEKHIKEKGHLKNIPSAAEVSKGGISLGEMDAKLLRKIEELTLYIIDLNKEIDSLKKSQ